MRQLAPDLLLYPISDVGPDHFLVPANGRDKVPARPEFVAQKIPHLAFDILRGRVEDWRAGRPFDRATFPAPSTSHAACGFPALRAPICFIPRLMGPIGLEQLSVRRIALDSR